MTTVICFHKKGTLRITGATDEVFAVVTEFLSRGQTWQLAIHAIAFHDHGFGIFLPDHPLATTHRDWQWGLIGNGNEVNEGVRTILGSVQVRHIEHFVHRDRQARKFF